jgi:hypothetical protein
MIIKLNARVSRVYIDLSLRALRHNDRHLVHLSLSALLKKDKKKIQRIFKVCVADEQLRRLSRIIHHTTPS